MAPSRAAAGLQQKEIDDFNGLDSLSPPDSVTNGFSPSCQNVDFEVDGIKPGSRYGTSTSFDLTAGTDVFQAKRIYGFSTKYFLFLMDDHKMYYSTGGARTLLVDTSAASPTGFSYALFGNLVFLFMHNGDKGVTQPYVWDPTNATVDLITITAPAKGTFAAADGAAGLCTVGTHKFLIIYETRTGFRAINTLTAQQLSWTTAGTVVIALTNIPVYAGETGHIAGEVVKRYVAMTAAGGSTFYLVPDANLSATLLNNTTTATNVSIADATLIAGTDVSSYFTFFQATTTAGAQAMPMFAKGFIFDNRMVMIGNDADKKTAPISEVNFPQEFRADVGFLQVSGNYSFRITNVFQMRAVLYLVLELGIVGFNDDGTPPSSWPQFPISADVGCISYDAVSNASDQDFCIIADFKGPYVFTGSPPFQIGAQILPTWATVSIPNQNQMRTIIDTRNKRILCFLPTGGATRCNTVFMGSYRNGFKNMRWTTWVTAGTAWREFIIDQPNILIATAGSTVRLLDSSATSDNGTAIAWFYRFEPIFATGNQDITYFDGMYIRATGVGLLNLRIYDTEGTLLATPTGWTLAAKPISDFYRGFNITEERVFFQIGQNDIGGQSDTTTKCAFSWVQFDIAPDGERPH